MKQTLQLDLKASIEPQRTAAGLSKDEETMLLVMKGAMALEELAARCDLNAAEARRVLTQLQNKDLVRSASLSD